MSKKPERSPGSTCLRRIRAEAPEPEVIRKAADIIRSGGMVVFPTRNLYGIGGDAFSRTAVQRVFHIKRRPSDKPVSLLIKSRAVLDLLAAHVPACAEKWMERFWPGHLTLVFQARPEVPAYLTAGTGKIGLRIPEHPAARALVEALDTPVTGTSANLSGEDGCHRIEDLAPGIRSNVQMILDAGPLPAGPGSTIVDVTTDPPVILREGTLSRQILFSS